VPFKVTRVEIKVYFMEKTYYWNVFFGFTPLTSVFILRLLYYSRWYTPLYPQMLALTSPTGGSCSVDIVRSRTQATEFVFVCFVWYTLPVANKVNYKTSTLTPLWIPRLCDVLWHNLMVEMDTYVSEWFHTSVFKDDIYLLDYTTQKITTVSQS
jgi:hypothetical protein